MGLRIFIISLLVTFLAIGILRGDFELKNVLIGFVIGLTLFIVWYLYKRFNLN